MMHSATPQRVPQRTPGKAGFEAILQNLNNQFNLCLFSRVRSVRERDRTGGPTLEERCVLCLHRLYYQFRSFSDIDRIVCEFSEWIQLRIKPLIPLPSGLSFIRHDAFQNLSTELRQRSLNYFLRIMQDELRLQKDRCEIQKQLRSTFLDLCSSQSVMCEQENSSLKRKNANTCSVFLSL